MKAISIFLKTLLFLVGVLVAVWIFLPWKQVGEYALATAVRRLETPITWATVNNVPGGFVIEDLKAQRLMGMGDVSFRTVTVIPDMDQTRDRTRAAAVGSQRLIA